MGDWLWLVVIGLLGLWLRERYWLSRHPLAGMRGEAQLNRRRLLDFAHIGFDWFWEIDAQGVVQACSPQIRQVLGVDAEQLVGRHWQSLRIARDNPEAAQRLVKQFAEGQAFRELMIAYTAPDGAQRYLALSAMPIRDERARLCGFRGVGRDVTERQALERALQQHQHNLQQTLAEQTLALIEAKAAAEAANQAKSQFLANISHELRTPLHAILNFAELGAVKAGRAEQLRLQQYFDNIQSGGLRLLHQLNDLIDLATLEAGRRPFHWQSLNLYTLVENCVAHKDGELAAKQLRVSVLSPPAPRLVGDHGSLEQVILNLLGNAIRFSPPAAHIQLRIDHCEQGLRLSVRDEGPGIPEAERERVFDKFEQSTRTRSGAGGSGLGLAICREIALAHGGNIHVDVQERGACLVLQLPLLPPLAQQRAAVADKSAV